MNATKTTTDLSLEITTTITVSKERISNLLCCALEGGSNYWYMIEKNIKPEADKLFHSMEGETFPHLDFPLSEGGAIMVSDAQITDDPEESCCPNQAAVRVDIPALLTGLRIMAEKFPHHYADFMAENEDADTGDCFLQCVVFGDVVYG